MMRRDYHQTQSHPSLLHTASLTKVSPMSNAKLGRYDGSHNATGNVCFNLDIAAETQFTNQYPEENRIKNSKGSSPHRATTNNEFTKENNIGTNS